VTGGGGGSGDDGEDPGGNEWPSRRARAVAAPGGSRGPDRPRRAAPADGRGSRRPGAARGTVPGRAGASGRASRSAAGSGSGAPNVDVSGTGNNGTGKNGTGKNGTGKNGTGKNGTGRNGTGRNGATRNGAGRNGTGQNGTAGSGAGPLPGGTAAGRRVPRPRGASGGPARPGPGLRAGPGRAAGARPRASAALRAPARAKAILLRRNPRYRLNATFVVIAVILSLFAGRLVQMQGLDWSRYRVAAAQQLTETLPIPTIRGSITTSDGTILAMTVQTEDIAADPAQMPGDLLKQAVADALAGPLAITPAALLVMLEHPPGPQYVLLKKNVSSTAAQQIDGLRVKGQPLPGISMTPSYTRSYPNGKLAASLIGFTDVSNTGDLTGEAGLEEEYNSLLAGRDGSEEVETGTDGVPIPNTTGKVTAPVPAKNLDLTINASIQYEAEQACQQEVRKAKARNCSIVVMQPHTGKILAIAQYPTFNPSDPSAMATTPSGDIAADDVFAPGSTLKPVTVAAALEKGVITPLTPYTVPDQIDVDGFEFHDAEVHPTIKFTVAGILANSLNDGMVQIVQKITPQDQYNYLRAFGLGSVSGLGLPGESAGLVPKPGTATYWGDDPYELSFGQGISVTAIQAASIYATIANGGVRVQPSLVAGTKDSGGQFVPAAAPAQRRVISAKTDRELMTMLQQVPGVDAAQGEPWGDIAGYPVAAKTGTAQVPDVGRCQCQYGSSYIGIAPAQDPQLVVAVNVQDPTRQGYYGDEIAGPVFYKVMKFSLSALQIPPTNAEPPHIRLTVP
jgi:cell division protein FtsI (penicillin-binding protein 3)